MNNLDDAALDKAFDNATFDHSVTVHDRLVMKQLWKEYINKTASPTHVENAKKE